jgi:hypothetical protein
VRQRKTALVTIPSNHPRIALKMTIHTSDTSQRVALVLTRPQVGEIRTCSVDFSMSTPNMSYAMWVNIPETRCQTNRPPS